MGEENEESLKGVGDEELFRVREDVVFVGEMPAGGVVFHGCVEEGAQQGEDELFGGGGN